MEILGGSLHLLLCVSLSRYTCLRLDVNFGDAQLTCFSIMAQVFVVVGASNVIAFIIRDLGDPALVGWIIQVRIPDIAQRQRLTLPGTPSDTECPLANRRSTLGCRGP